MTDAGNEKVECEDYDIPYNECVPSDPSFEEMKKVICDHGLRPEIPTRWNKSKVIKNSSTLYSLLLRHQLVFINYKYIIFCLFSFTVLEGAHENH